MLPIILKDRSKDQFYVEPFVGGANVIDKVHGHRIGSDSNKYLIALLKAMKDEWTPPYVDKDFYEKIKSTPENYSDELVGFAATQLTYGSKWFDSYRRDSVGLRDYAQEAINNINKQSSNLEGIEFICSDYSDLEIPPNCIIYCDPPYCSTTRYTGVDPFNTIEFWDWCSKMVIKGHSVFVSEYTAPDDWNCVWEKRVNSSLTKDTGCKKQIEKLFTK